METKVAMPEQLPISLQDCRTLAVWRTLVKGESQREVAERGRVKQSRISEVERGAVIPRRRHWPALMASYGLNGQPDSEAHFYRMIMTGRADWLRLRALQKPIAETEPLFSQNVHAPAGKIVIARVESGSEGRAQA